MMQDLEQRLDRIESLLRLQAKDALTTKEAAHLLNISEAHLTRLARERKVPYYRQGRNFYYSKRELLDQLLQNHYPAMATQSHRS